MPSPVAPITVSLKLEAAGTLRAVDSGDYALSSEVVKEADPAGKAFRSFLREL